jgi:hypothetical protein
MPRRARTDDLQTLPAIGPSLAADLRALGVRRAADFKRLDPERLVARLNRLRRHRQDNDAEFRLTGALALPTLTIEGMRLLRRLTLLIRANRIEHCFYPVFPPDADADHVLDWLRGRRVW